MLAGVLCLPGIRIVNDRFLTLDIAVSVKTLRVRQPYFAGELIALQRTHTARFDRNADTFGGQAYMIALQQQIAVRKAPAPTCSPFR